MTGPGRPPIGAVREIRFPDDLWSRVEALADDYGVSRADMVRRMLRFAADEADHRGWDILG